MIGLKQVTKSFDDHRALSELTLEIEQARTTVLIGQSGCGKSTALRVMIGLIEPDQGEVVIQGQKVTLSNVLSVRRRVGYVIQGGGLFPHLTARENVTLMARHLRWPDDLIRARLFTLSELVQLRPDRFDLYPVELSGGEQQRIGLMRALFLDPDILLMDEPLGALDPMIRAGLQDELRDIFHELEKTVVLVTHDLAEAAFLGDRIALLHEGRLVQVGTIADLTDAPVDPYVTEFVSAQRHLSL